LMDNYILIEKMDKKKWNFGIFFKLKFRL